MDQTSPESAETAEVAPLAPLTDDQVVEVARGIATGDLMVVDIDDPDWQASLALVATAQWPPNVGLLLVPLGDHQQGMWLNGRVPAVTLTIRMVPEESLPAVREQLAAINRVLWPEKTSGGNE